MPDWRVVEFVDNLKVVSVLAPVLDDQLPAPRYTPGLKVSLVHLLLFLVGSGPFHVSLSLPV